MRYVYYAIGTGLGTGFSPIAPGTAGSLLMLLLIYGLGPISAGVLLGVLVVLFFLGVFTGTYIEKERGEDPPIVVIDEMVGMGISLWMVPYDWRLYAAAFVLFRIFDIYKPPPIEASQRVSAGWGIMLDDVIAGIYALILTHLINYFFF